MAVDPLFQSTRYGSHAMIPFFISNALFSENIPGVDGVRYGLKGWIVGSRNPRDAATLTPGFTMVRLMNKN